MDDQSADASIMTFRKKSMFSDRVSEIRRGLSGNEVEFDAALLETIEPDIERCRVLLAKAIERNGNSLWRERKEERHPLHGLEKESSLSFDTARYPLREAFAASIDLDQAELDRIHERFQADSGKKRDRKEKRCLLQGLTEPSSRTTFRKEYLKLLLEVIAPNVAEEYGCDQVYCQSFPCVRVNRPAEFSIGPHCDAMYGHVLGNLNYYLPLTNIWGSNSLFLESSPGAEDWHPIKSQYGDA